MGLEGGVGDRSSALTYLDLVGTISDRVKETD